MWVRFLMDLYYLDLGRIGHFPITVRVELDPNILTHSFITNAIKGCIGQVKNKRFMASIPAERARVERKTGIMCPAIPIKKGSGRYLHVPGQENAPENLNRIAPWNGYGPGPGFVIANWLLYEPSRVQLHGPIQTLQGLYPAHVWKYGLYHVQVMEGYQWCNWMGRKKPKEVAVHVKLFNVKQSKAMSNVGKN